MAPIKIYLKTFKPLKVSCVLRRLYYYTRIEITNYTSGFQIIFKIWNQIGHDGRHLKTAGYLEEDPVPVF